MKRFVIELSDDAFNRLKAFTKAVNKLENEKNTYKDSAENLLSSTLSAHNDFYFSGEETDDGESVSKIYHKEYDRLRLK